MASIDEGGGETMREWADLEEAVQRRDWLAARELARWVADEWRAVQGFVEAVVGADVGLLDDAVRELVGALEATPVDPRRLERAMAPLRSALQPA